MYTYAVKHKIMTTKEQACIYLCVLTLFQPLFFSPEAHAILNVMFIISLLFLNTLLSLTHYIYT